MGAWPLSALLLAGFAQEESLRTEPLARVDDVRSSWSLSPDGPYGAVRGKDGIILLRLETGKAVPLAKPERFLSVAFESGSEWAWMGTLRGTAVRVRLSDGREETECEIAPGMPVEGLNFSEGILAWNGQKRGGVYDSGAKKAVATWDAVEHPMMFNGDDPRVTLASDGTQAVFYSAAREGLQLIGHEEGGLEIWSIAEGRRTASLPLYVSDNTPGYVVGRKQLLYGTRTGMSKFEIRAWDLATGNESLVDGKARKGHFLDLYLSPSGRFLAEGDFEKKGVRLYDLDGESDPRTLGEEERCAPVAFVRIGERERLLALDKTGLSIWDPIPGKCLAKGAAPVPGRIERAAAMLEGSRLALLWWDSQGDGKPVRYHLSILKVLHFP